MGIVHDPGPDDDPEWPRDGDFLFTDDGKTYQRCCGRWVWLIPMWVPAEEVE